MHADQLIRKEHRNENTKGETYCQGNKHITFWIPRTVRITKSHMACNNPMVAKPRTNVQYQVELANHKVLSR
jgi:hypothetical protein